MLICYTIPFARSSGADDFVIPMFGSERRLKERTARDGEDTVHHAAIRNWQRALNLVAEFNSPRSVGLSPARQGPIDSTEAMRSFLLREPLLVVPPHEVQGAR